MSIEGILIKEISGFIVIPGDYDEKRYYRFLKYLEDRFGVDAKKLDENSVILEDTKVEEFLFYREDLKNEKIKNIIDEYESMDQRYNLYIKNLIDNRRFLVEKFFLKVGRYILNKEDIYVLLLFKHKPASLDIFEDNRIVERVFERGFSYGLSFPKYSNLIVVYVGGFEEAVNVLLHELGHLFGLEDHKEDKECIMSPGIFVKKCQHLL